MQGKIKVSKVSSLYMLLGFIFATCLLVSNIIAAKQVAVGSWILTAGVICFPISYIVADVIAEVYGFRAAKRVILYSFAMNLLMVVIFYLAILWPAPAFAKETAESFANILSNTPRILIASLTAYLVGSLVNAKLLDKMKLAKIGGVSKWAFPLRAIGSTLVGECLDSLIFIPIAFLGVLPTEALPQMILLQVAFKTVYEIAILPLTTYVVHKVTVLEACKILQEAIELDE